MKKIDKVTICVKNNPFLTKNCQGYQSKLKSAGIKVINDPKDYKSSKKSK